MDVNISNIHMDGLCVACLTTGRRLEPLAGAARRYYREIVEEAVGTWSELVYVCWECAAGVRGALRLRRRVAAAATALLQHQKFQYGMDLQSSNSKLTLDSKYLGSLQSLSRLSSHSNNTVLYITHKDQTGNDSQDEVSGSMFIKLENKEYDFDDAEELYVEDIAEPTVDDVDDRDLKAVLKSDILKNETETSQSSVKKKKSKRKTDTEEFNESDDEPLTLKKHKQENRKARGKRKIDKNEKSKEQGSRQRRLYREKPAGVVKDARVLARLQRLNVPAGALEMVVLTWQEVEAERDRMLSTETYTRHEHRCAHCALGFNQRTKLQQHMRKHDLSSGPHECSLCHIRCREPHALAAHRRRHRVRWRCCACGALWSRAAVAADHVARDHAAALPTHVCPICQHVASTLGKLRTHLKEHARRVRCDQCGKSLRDRASLRSHLQIHLGVKEHECPSPGCGKRFVFKKAMQLHAATHQQHQHLYCDKCDMTFKNQITFYHHMKYNLKHADRDTFKHACAECGLRFSSPARLGEHRAALHLHIAPVKCTHDGCTYACASRPGLRAHVRSVHRGLRAARNHVCHTCGKAYTSKKTLEGHLRAHTGERPFVCGRCPAAFGYHAALYNHTRLVHHTHTHKVKRSHDSPAPPPAPAPLTPPAPPPQWGLAPPRPSDTHHT